MPLQSDVDICMSQKLSASQNRPMSLKATKTWEVPSQQLQV